MISRPKAIFCWSGGKDSAYCLHKVLTANLYDVIGLLTTVNATHRRVSMHGVREELLRLQAESIGIPLRIVYVSDGTNEEYEKEMETALLEAKAKGANHVIFGDIFLEDLRAYREQNLAKVGMQAVFPLWKRNTAELISDFLREGFKTITCCTNDAWLGQDQVGHLIDLHFIETLPAAVDPCGENGEYHTFCFDGPLFSHPVNFTVGEKVYRPFSTDIIETAAGQPITRGFWFCDLLPAG